MTYRMIRFSSTQEVNNPVCHLITGLRQSLSYLRELVLFGMIDCAVATTVSCVDISTVNDQKLNLSSLAELCSVVQWSCWAFLFVDKVWLSTLHEQAKRRFEIGRSDTGVKLLTQFHFENRRVVSLQVWFQYEFQVDMLRSNELRLDRDRFFRVGLTFLLFRVGIQKDVLPHRVGTVGVDLVDEVQNWRVPASLSQSFHDRNVGS